MDTPPAINVFSSLSSPYQLLIGLVFLHRMTRLVQTQAYQMQTNKNGGLTPPALEIRSYMFNGLRCDSEASSSRFSMLIQVLLCKSC